MFAEPTHVGALKRLHLLHSADRTEAQRRIVIAALIGWLPLAVLSATEALFAEIGRHFADSSMIAPGERALRCARRRDASCKRGRVAVADGVASNVYAMRFVLFDARAAIAIAIAALTRPKGAVVLRNVVT